MADARLLHKRSSAGERILALSDFEYRVWVQFVLSADDYGVMRGSVTVLMADNPYLERQPVSKLERAIGVLLTSGLISTFTHQGVTYWWQPNWQDFQSVQYPRDTILPAPGAADLERATPATRTLFSVHHLPARERSRKLRDTVRVVPETVPETVLRTVPERVQNLSETVPAYAGARARETLTPTLTLTPQGSEASEESARETTATASPVVWAEAASMRTRPAPRQNHSLVGNHIGCYFAPDACAAGMCVPSWLGAQWTQQYRGDDVRAEREIREFIAATLVDLQPGHDPKKFWPAAWAARHGAAPPSPPPMSKGDHSRAAMNRTLQRKVAAGELS